MKETENVPHEDEKQDEKEVIEGEVGAEGEIEVEEEGQAKDEKGERNIRNQRSKSISDCDMM